MDHSGVPTFSSAYAPNPLSTMREHVFAPRTSQGVPKVSDMNIGDVISDREAICSSVNSSDDRLEQLLDGEEESVGMNQSDEPEPLLEVDEGTECPPKKPPRSYLEDTLPDLLCNGTPLRRRVSSPVSNTLKQVRREVELSRRRSLKLKAQVDKLQEQTLDGPGWSQNRQRVTEEVESIVKLLLPLTDVRSSAPDPSAQGNRLDTALLQLQSVARSLALQHTNQGKDNGRNSGEEGAILQQALRDRDEALAKKNAMEGELLRSKTEMMLLNNQLLEAVQQRLELSLELDAWKDDVQTILHHQVMLQQQAEQAAQKKPSRLGVLRRTNKPTMKPFFPATATPTNATITPVPSPSATPPSTPVAQRWRERLRRGRVSRLGENSEQSPSEHQLSIAKMEDSFQSVSLD